MPESIPPDEEHGDRKLGSGRLSLEIRRSWQEVRGSSRRFSLEQSIRDGLAGKNWGEAAGPDQVFGRESEGRKEDEGDDEEALKWAALERLPTYDRLRTAILKNISPSGRFMYNEQVDVRRLGFAQRQRLIATLLKVAHDDNEAFLTKLRARLDRVGIRVPTTEVRFHHLCAEADIHVGARNLPTLPNTVLAIFEAVLENIGFSLTSKATLPILKDVSGIVRPSRMTLLLGPPGSGKTTLLLALGGRMSPDLRVQGRICYNGHDLTEFVPRKTSAYIGQTDLHIGEMTVRETLDFSARYQGVGRRYEILLELVRREKEAGILPEADIDLYMKAIAMEGVKSSLVIDYILKILGLDICSDIRIGDQLRRGISGGQKKRVTTGEMIVGPAKTLFMDEISTGLDSSTTFQILKCLGQFVHILDGTIFVSLLQPAPDSYNLFDDIVLLSEGQIVYQGPREFVLPFFEECGFRCPDRKGVADFLQEVTSRKDQQQYWYDKEKPYQYVTVKQFVNKLKKFHVGQQLEAELDSDPDKSDIQKAALVFDKYSMSKWELLRANWEKEVLLMKRNSFVYIFKGIQISLTGFISGTLFFRTRLHQDTPDDGQSYLSALFFGLLIIMFNGFAELSFTLMRLPVFFKQRDLLFYPSWAYAIPAILTKIPISFIDSFMFTLISYFLTGYAPQPSRFFKQFLVFFLEHMMAASLFRTIAALSRSLVIASTGGSLALLTILILGGFIIPRPRIRKWWIWAYWSSPLAYAETALSVNEFLAPRWMNKTFKLPNGELKPLGEYILKNRGLFYKHYWYWISVGALLGFILLLNVVYVLALTYLNTLSKPQAILSKEEMTERQRNEQGEDKTGGDVVKMPMSDSSTSSRVLSSTFGAEDIVLEGKAEAATKRGMILPFTPCSISFDNICYSVDMPAEMKAQGLSEDRLELLRGISGAFTPGVLTALVGVSGAGKTTLMDVLAGRKTGGYVDGDIRISGFPKKQETFARISGYCEQNDIHSPQVTVYEALLYSAWLRLPHDIPPRSRKAFVEEVMELVELSPLRDALVGLPGVSGLSTEQRKRLTIAVELVANPSIIFMDEPTSGLDARAAAIVMRTVRNTVNTGRTVVCTIHQPSIDIFESFDELLLLKRGGQVIYAGQLGRHSCKLLDYFQAVPGVPAMQEGMNPATWMLDVTSDSMEARLGVDFAEIYANSALYKENKSVVKEFSVPKEGSKDLSFSTQFSQPFFVQLQACLWKQFWSYWRSPGYNLVRFIFSFLCALIFGTIFWQVGRKIQTQQDLFNVMGAMYGSTMFLGVNNGSSVQPVVAVERTVFYRERGAGFYSPRAYALSQVLIELPFVFFQSTYYTLITYALIGYFWEPAKFFWYFYIAFCTFLYFTYYGMMSVALTPNIQLAAVFSSSLYPIFNVFAGFIIPRPRIPGWWVWAYWISPVGWTVTGLLTSQYADLDTHRILLTDGSTPTVKDFLKDYFGFETSLLPAVGIVISLYPVLFSSVFLIATQRLNFQRR